MEDEDGIPGQSYHYAVSAMDAEGEESARSAPAGPVRSAWTRSPHGGSVAGSPLCGTCHASHAAGSERSVLRRTGAGAETEVTLCLSCHDGQGGASADVRSGPGGFATAAGSGHRMGVSGLAGALTRTCSSCHSPHKDASEHPKLPASVVNGKSAGRAGNEWCLACHDADASWFGEGYPATSAPLRAGNGYPVAGTFPGPATYADPSRNAHARIPSGEGTADEAGGCLACHEPHRSSAPYDGLRGALRPSTAATAAEDGRTGAFAEACFRCHGDGAPEAVTGAAADVRAAYAGGGGHRIRTAGGTLPAGAPMPCYDCHNPHGSSRGNAGLLSDELGGGLDPSTPEGYRAVCLSCHTSTDGEVWDSDDGRYVAVGAQTVEGLRRDGTGGGALRLSDIPGHGSADTGACSACHGGPHDPASRVSEGAQEVGANAGPAETSADTTYGHEPVAPADETDAPVTCSSSCHSSSGATQP